MPTTERSSIEGPTLQRSPQTSRTGFASLVYPMSMVWASSLVRTSNTADSSLLLPHNKRLEVSGGSDELRGKGKAQMGMNSRRRVNSDVMFLPFMKHRILIALAVCFALFCASCMGSPESSFFSSFSMRQL